METIIIYIKTDIHHIQNCDTKDLFHLELKSIDHVSNTR